MEIHFCPRRASTMTVWTSTDPHRPLYLRDASLWCFASAAFASMVLAALYWTPLGLLTSHFRSSRPQEDPYCPRRVLPSTELGHFRGLRPRSGQPQVMAPTPTPNQDYLTPGTLPPGPFPRMLASLGSGPQRFFLQGALPHGPPLPCLGHQA
jgi:hypothetical protein